MFIKGVTLFSEIMYIITFLSNLLLMCLFSVEWNNFFNCLQHWHRNVQFYFLAIYMLLRCSTIKQNTYCNSMSKSQSRPDEVKRKNISVEWNLIQPKSIFYSNFKNTSLITFIFGTGMVLGDRIINLTKLIVLTFILTLKMVLIFTLLSCFLYFPW